MALTAFEVVRLPRLARPLQMPLLTHGALRCGDAMVAWRQSEDGLDYIALLCGTRSLMAMESRAIAGGLSADHQLPGVAKAFAQRKGQPWTYSHDRAPYDRDTLHASPGTCFGSAFHHHFTITITITIHFTNHQPVWDRGAVQ